MLMDCNITHSDIHFLILSRTFHPYFHIHLGTFALSLKQYIPGTIVAISID